MVWSEAIIIHTIKVIGDRSEQYQIGTDVSERKCSVSQKPTRWKILLKFLHTKSHKGYVQKGTIGVTLK